MSNLKISEKPKEITQSEDILSLQIEENRIRGINNLDIVTVNERNYVNLNISSLSPHIPSMFLVLLRVNFEENKISHKFFISIICSIGLITLVSSFISGPQ